MKSRGANSGGTWELGSQKEFGLAERNSTLIIRVIKFKQKLLKNSSPCKFLSHHNFYQNIFCHNVLFLSREIDHYGSRKQKQRICLKSELCNKQ